MSHFGAPFLRRGYFYALVPVRHTPTRFSIPFGIRQSSNMELYVFLPVFQLREIKEANQQAILNALRHPDANITKLLEETEAKYKSKSPVTLSQTSHKYPGYCFLLMAVLPCSHRQRCPRL